MSDRTCSVSGCTNAYRSRGYCISHYNRKLRSGELKVIHGQAPDEERFWRFVDATGVCWEWTGSRHFTGYGQFAARGKKAWRAHRYAWTILVGDIPKDMTLDHLCRNKPCVNPDHMEVVTAVENNRRGGSSSAINARKTHCKRGHEFTPDNLYVQYNKGKPGRQCRTCTRTYQSARKKGIPLPDWW